MPASKKLPEGVLAAPAVAEDVPTGVLRELDLLDGQLSHPEMPGRFHDADTRMLSAAPRLRLPVWPQKIRQLIAYFSQATCAAATSRAREH